VDLIDGEDFGVLTAQVLSNAGAILQDVSLIVVRALTAIESGVETLRHAALAGEKAVAYAGKVKRGTDEGL
jgi:hypothetical protein